MTIICTPVGTPTFSTIFRIFGSTRMWRAKSASGARGLLRARSRKANQVVATTKDTTVAAAPLATPSIGRPPQPRMSAGVSNRPMPVEMASVKSGVTVSPTPRSMAVDSRKTKSPGIAIRMMRA